MTSGHVAYFPPHLPYIMTCRLLFPTWLLPTMTLAIICRNGSEPFERTLLTVLIACQYHPSLSSLHSLHFPPFSFIYLLPPSFSFIHLPLFAFINRLPSFIFIHLHSNSFISSYFNLHSPSSTSSTPISVDPPSSTWSTVISLHKPSSHTALKFWYCGATQTPRVLL